jgi:hypothetical protein
MNTLRLLLLSSLLALETANALQLNGRLTDGEFKESQAIRIELVESGQVLEIRYNEPFSLQLPQDTVWSLCVLDDGREKCFELRYAGKDSVFNAEISGDETVLWYNDGSSDLAEADYGLKRETQQVDVDSLLKSGSSESLELRKVVVQLRRKPKRKIGESVVSAKNIKRMPNLAEADVMRSIQALPGVVASSDFSTKIYVRGGGSDQNLFLLDNGIVYSPAHFFGLFSSFLVEAVDDVKFYKSGFQPEYGNRLSSVAAINSREGGQDTVDEWFSKNSLKISTFATQAHTEGHQGNARWVLAGRTTYIKQILDALKATGITDFSMDYKFYDIQGVFDYNLGTGRDLRLSLYTGADVLNFDPLFVEWGNTVIPVNLKWRINDNWDLRSSLSYSLFYQEFKIVDLMSIRNDISTFASRQALTFNGFASHAPTVGYDAEYSEVTFIQESEMSKQRIEDINKPWHHILYAQDIWKILNWEFQYGLRFNYHVLSEQFGLEPRFSAKWNLTEDQSINYHLGYYEQYLNSLMFSDQEMLNEYYYPTRKSVLNGKIKPASSILTVLGYTFDNIFDAYSFNAEAYYKTQNNLMIYSDNVISDSAANLITSLADFLKTGEGYSFGYEISLRKPAGVVSGGLSWSQGWSVVKEQGNPTPYFPNWHQPYSMKLDLAVNWRGEDGIWQYENKKPGRYFRSSAQLKWASGMPSTEYLGYHGTHDIDQSYPGFSLSGAEHDQNIAVPLGNRNTSLQPDYFRLDIKPIDVGRENKWNFSFTILNVTNHENIFFYSYDTSVNPPKLDKIAQFPFFPLLLSYEYYF